MNEVRKLYNNDGCVLKEASSNDYESWSSARTLGPTERREEMTEELVTLETAKLLKEKGMFTDIEFPPQSVAQKWLRETKNIHICIYNCACGYGYEISKADNGTHITSSVYEGTNDGSKWDIYEEALEAGLQEALKLI